MRSVFLRSFTYRIFALVFLALLLVSSGAMADVVVSQVYGGGGATTGTPAYTNDYVELFNRGAGAVDISGFSIQYGSSSGQFGSSAGNIYTFPASTSIGAGKYLTVKLGTVGTVGATFTADLTTTNINMAAGSGKVAFLNSATALGCGATATPCTLPDARIFDSVAYGASNNGEGGTTVNNGVALTNTQGGVRKSSGCTDTNNNNGDFSVATTATGLVPRTTASPASSCTNSAPTITAPANPIASVTQDAPPFTVSLTGSDDLSVYSWSATAGTGISSVIVSGGQATSSVTYTVTLQAGYSGTASFTASLSDTVNAAASRIVNIQVTAAGGGNLPPVITPPANPISTVPQDAAPFTVSLTGSDDAGIYNWSVTPGTGVATVSVTNGQGTATVTYTVTLAAGFSGTATFTASLSDNVNPSATATVNITVTPPPPPANHVTVSQLYGGGGNSGATYSNDYVELYNPTATSVDMAGWSVQYASSSGTFSQIQPIGGLIAPGEFFLIGLASGGAVGSALPTPNISGDINMSGTAGKIALVNNGIALSGTCSQWLANPALVDFVGYGTANCSEGNSNAAAPGNTTSLFRKSSGSTDTNVNGSDFFTATPAPRRTSPIQEIGPAVLNTDPLSNAASAPRDASMVITFTEPVDVDANWFTINCASTGVHTDATFTEAFARTWIIIPNTNFVAGEQCTATIYRNFVHDRDLDDSAPNTDTLAADYTWTFTVSTGTLPPYAPGVHLTMGNPSAAVADVNLPNNYLMEKPEMAISYNRDKGTPNWVSWHLTDEWIGTLTRVDTFRPDPAVPSNWYRVLGSDYFASGFDRGHMTPNADRDKETSIPINQATFLMSNMVPQAPDNNQGPWAAMESELRTLLPANELYIVSGPYGVGGTGSSGPASTIARGNVTVPASTWKVVLVLPKASGDDVSRVTASTRTIAVVMPNTQGIRNNDWHGYIVSVDQVESLTGYDFFPNVPDAIENSIEAGINGTNPPGTANQSVSTREDVAKAFTLDSVSSNGNALTYTIVTPPAYGTLTGTDASQTYTPNSDFNGSDSFTYRVNDGARDSNIATVTVTTLEVNDAPLAVDDTKSTGANTTLAFAASDLTANDQAGPANESGQTLTVTSVTTTANTHGNVTLSSGQVTYVPTANYDGPASFGYTVCDNGVTAGLSDSLCATATVSVTVNPPPPATHFSVVAPASVNAGTPFNVTITALDAAEVPVPTYAGTVHFTSSSAGTLPADYAFTLDDNGAHTFSFTLTTTGSQSISAGDGSIAGTTSTTVTCVAPSNVSITAPAQVCPLSTDNSASVADAGPGVTYEWKITNGTLTNGAGTLSVLFTAGSSGNTSLSVTVTSIGGCSSMALRDVVVSTPPSITLPLVVTSCPGPVTIPVTLTGTAPWTIVWSDGLTQTNVTTSTTFRTLDATESATISVTSLRDSSCSSSGSSQPVQILIEHAPTITEQPRNINVPAGQAATFTVAATGSETLHYQWFLRDGQGTLRPVGVDSTSLTVAPVRGRMEVWVVVSDACGSVESGHVTADIAQRRHGARR
ncbi:MAG TPA: DNA/RNA non-specific endonuclease [Thermoanaerobaculia bacterium]|nr:DNA/RNA non-specific endonuclease [Thermoanaerobaculia bacterium]